MPGPGDLRSPGTMQGRFAAWRDAPPSWSGGCFRRVHMPVEAAHHVVTGDAGLVGVENRLPDGSELERLVLDQLQRLLLELQQPLHPVGQIRRQRGDRVRFHGCGRLHHFNMVDCLCDANHDDGAQLHHWLAGMASQRR